MRILYLMQVNWDWVFQRPHILALYLEKDYECTVLNRRVLFKPLTSKTNKRPHKMITVWQLPKQNMCSLFSRINEYIYKWFFRNINNYDAVWVTHPNQFEFIRSFHNTVIYDCMDYHFGLNANGDSDNLFEVEQELIKRANIIFVSSNYLKEIVPNIDKAILVNNGFEAKNIYPVKNACKKDRYRIGYIGTVSTWFDYELIEQSAQVFNNVEYHIIGPVLVQNERKLKNIIFDGVIDHNVLYEHIKEFDALIMPFTLDEAIKAVDPVKLYEYISFGKCIVSVKYPEVERFSEFSYLYNNYDEYIAIINGLIDSGFKPQYTDANRRLFLESNSWDKRYGVILNAMKELNKDA